MTKQEYVNSIKIAILNLSTKSIVAYIKVQIPFFNLPIISNILDMLVKQIMSIAINETEMAVFFTFIDLRINAQGREFSNLAIKNAEIQKIGTPEEKAQSEKELIDSFRALVKFSS